MDLMCSVSDLLRWHLMMRRVSGAAIFFLVSCSAPQSPLVQTIGERDVVAQDKPLTLSPEEQFAMDIARQRQAGVVESTISNWHLRGIYAGRQGVCDAVNVQNITLKHSSDYLICGDRITLAQGVAPSFPAEGNITRLSVAKSAWTNGQSVQRWGEYHIQARTIGPMRGDGCAMVQTIVTYQGMLVEQSQEQICD